MSLKCHLCGKVYHHDMKLCQSCEEITNHKSLRRGGLNVKKWRCDKFLELKGLPFGSHLGKELELTPKTREITHREKLKNYEYEWNLINTISVERIEMNQTKINHFLKFE